MRPTSARHSGPLGRYQMPLITRMTSLGSTSARRVPDAAPASSSRPSAPRIRARVSANNGESDAAAERSAYRALGGDVVGKAFRPGAQGVVRGQAGEQVSGRGAQRVHLVAVGGDNQRLAVREVAVQRPDPDAGAGGD